VSLESDKRIGIAWKKSLAKLIAEEYIRSEYDSIVEFLHAIYGHHIPTYEGDSSLFEKMVDKNIQNDLSHSMNEALE